MAVGRTYFDKPGDLSPLEVYVAMKSLFGEPNREMIDEDKQQWTFLLKTSGAVLEVYDWKRDSWSIGVYEDNGEADHAESIAGELVTLLKRTIPKHRNTLREVTNQVTGQVVENPFALYYDTASELLELAKRFSSVELREPNAFAEWSKQYILCRSALFQFVSSVEGLLNLIYDLYLKPELRDDRIVDRLSREQIDVKLRLAPVYCECFAGKPLDHTTEAFRNFHSLANLRNDFVHANLTKSMRTPVVRHDGATYLLSASMDKPVDLIPASFSSLGIDDLSAVKAAVDSIATQLLSNMKPRFRREFREVMYNEHIYVEYDDGVPVVMR